MTVAKDWCHRNGWTAVRDVGAGKLGGDLEAVDSSGVRRLIEVKGTTGTSVSMEVTKHEVDSAIQHGCLLTRRRARHRCPRRRHAESDQRCRLCVRPVGAKTVRTRRTDSGGNRRRHGRSRPEARRISDIGDDYCRWITAITSNRARCAGSAAGCPVPRPVRGPARRTQCVGHTVGQQRRWRHVPAPPFPTHTARSTAQPRQHGGVGQDAPPREVVPAPGPPAGVPTVAAGVHTTRSPRIEPDSAAGATSVALAGMALSPTDVTGSAR
ncbi:MAG: protein NO VEIN domain-containing protein [Geodermatophilaceae bacterium]